MSTPLASSKVFKPLKVGNVELQHRIFFPPTTRCRSTKDHVPTDLQLKYYDDRSKFPGTLIISEGTFVSPQSCGMPHVPGIWNDTQVKAWKKINDKIHENGSFISCQFWNLGRGADPEDLKNEGTEFLGSSNIYPSEEIKEKAEKIGNPLRAFTTEEIKHVIHHDYVNAAENAIKAGFDMVELHSAHGYIFDQFLQPAGNNRTDEYGGSIENRARFVLEVIDAISAKIGASKVAIRISPWAKFLGMKAEEDEVHPIANFGYLLSELQKRANEGKELAYISIVEPRVQGNTDVAKEDQLGDNTFIYQIWKGIIVRAGNYTYDAPKFTQIIKDVEDDRTLVGFSRYYISNPDLVFRLQQGLELNQYDRSTFYNQDNYRYNTYKAYGETETVEQLEAAVKRLGIALA